MRPVERVIQRWYRSLTPDGQVWCETSSAEECVERSKGRAVSFQVMDVVQIDKPWEAWVPDASR